MGHLHDHLTGRTGHAALLLSTELCSLTLQSTDASMANLVAGALFGDGAGALVAVGRDHPLYATGAGPEVVAARSRLYPGTEHLLGWDIGHWGMRMVLGRELPDLVRLHVAEEVESFLAAHDLKPADVGAWICHPGGPKILDTLSDALALPESAFAASRMFARGRRKPLLRVGPAHPGLRPERGTASARIGRADARLRPGFRLRTRPPALVTR